MQILPLILLAACINTAAQLLLKAGADRLTLTGFSWPMLWPMLLQIALNPYVMIGLACYVFSVGVWLVILSKAQVSFAYPLMSLAYVTTAIAAAILFKEPLSLTRVVGILVIIFGVYIIMRS